jgi:hypothetical protein
MKKKLLETLLRVEAATANITELPAATCACDTAYQVIVNGLAGAQAKMASDHAFTCARDRSRTIGEDATYHHCMAAAFVAKAASEWKNLKASISNINFYLEEF